MGIKTKRNITAVVTFIITVLSFFLFSSCSMENALIKEFPDQETVGVVRVLVYENGEETKTELSEEKTDLFFEYLNDLKYKKRNNIFGIKTKLFDYVTYIITYDNYTVKLSEHHLLILHNGENEKEISFDTLQPSDTFNKIDRLFA